MFLEQMMKDELTSAAIAHFEAQRTEARANLLVYFMNPMGIGEHSNLVTEVVQLTKQIAEAEECIKVLKEV